MYMTSEDLLKDVNLRYSTDSKPGFSRRRAGKKFEYFDLDEKKIRDEKVIERINSLAIPPAYTGVWICPYANGHLQATGYDQKRRKQYRYHPLWHKISSEEKFSHIMEFAEKLPSIRKKLESDLGLVGLPRSKVIAAVVWLLENTLIRIGNEEYEKENNSYGLTTLKNKHVTFQGSGKIKLAFKGKSGVYHNVTFKNKKVAAIIRRCVTLPGQDLFEYKDENGDTQTVSSHHVNEYLQEITGAEITAKDFRTWGGTILAAAELNRAGVTIEEVTVKKNIADTVKKVATHLRNKPNTCRKYYIHPFVIDAYTQGYIVSNLDTKKGQVEGLHVHENKVLSLITHMLKHQKSA